MAEELQISVKEGTDVGKVREHNEDFVLIPVGGPSARPRAGYSSWRTEWVAPG
jgi:hypothetical protein